jgi:DNA invertase Pin-like site-specific DNA recombinase
MCVGVDSIASQQEDDTMTHSKGQTVGYVRVSTIDQNAERQLEGVELDKVFTDKASGKDTNRPALKEAMGWVRGGDVLVVHSMDRLARNVEDMLRIVRELTTKGVTVRFQKENMTFDASSKDPRNTFFFTILSAFAEFERSMIKERQLEGIALAKKRGVYKGKSPYLSPAQKKEVREMAAQQIPKTVIGRKFGVSRDTIYRALAEETA